MFFCVKNAETASLVKSSKIVQQMFLIYKIFSSFSKVQNHPRDLQNC